MMDSRRGIGLAIAISSLFCISLAHAQENLDLGKTPAQLYASDCAICHKSPRGLTAAGGIFGLQSFLREHYTASRESAAAIAAYLKTIDRGPSPADRRRAQPKRAPSKPAEKNNVDQKKPGGKTADKKASEHLIGQQSG